MIEPVSNDPFILARTRFYNERLVQARKESGFETITDAANAMGVSVGTLGSAERMSTYPQNKMAERIADFYDKPIEWLFSEKYKQISKIKKTVKRTYLEQSISEEKYVSLESKEAQRLLITDGDNLETNINEADLKMEIERVLNNLDKREEYVIKASFGLGRPSASLREIANELNLTRERVRQIKEKAILRLRHKAKSKVLKMFI